MQLNKRFISQKSLYYSNLALFVRNIIGKQYISAKLASYYNRQNNTNCKAVRTIQVLIENVAGVTRRGISEIVRASKHPNSEAVISNAKYLYSTERCHHVRILLRGAQVVCLRGIVYVTFFRIVRTFQTCYDIVFAISLGPLQLVVS